jgi:Calx-beta domain/Domain of unknown function DUF11
MRLIPTVPSLAAIIVALALPASASAADIGNPLSPLTLIDTSTELNCSVNHVGDAAGEFFGGNACGTFVATPATADGTGTLYGPSVLPAGGGAGPRTSWTAVSQTPVSGAGTAGDPRKATTVVDAGDSGLRITQTDSYVYGTESYTTQIQVENTTGTAKTARVYHAGDCYLQDSDQGFGAVDNGAVACVAGISDPDTGDVSRGTRIEQFLPLTAGSHYMEAGFSEVWSHIGTQQEFPDTCICGNEQTDYLDNGAGLSWTLAIPANSTKTVSLVTTFSPQGVQPITTTKTAAQPSVSPGGDDSYTITFSNPNTSPVTLTAIRDTLPAGFTYAAGTTTGATTANPTVNGQELTWTGSFIVPARSGQTNGTLTMTFGVHAGSTPGQYLNNAGGESSTVAVLPTGDTAPVTVTQPAGPTLAVDDVTVTEGNSGTTNATFHVTLSEPASGTVTVNAATSNGTATQPGDYTSTSTTPVTFNDGESSKDFVVPVVGDTLDEHDETFNVTLSSPANASISDGTGVGTITDDDAPPAISIDDTSVTEGAAPGTVNAVFTVTLSQASGKAITADFATANGTATQPADYTSNSGTLTFSPGQTSKTVTVVVKGDAVDEDDETFTVGLSGLINLASVGNDTSGTGTITDDDPPPTISIGDVTVTEGNSGTTAATFTVSLSQASSRGVSVSFATADGTATQPADYQAASGSVSFDPGQTSKTVTVNVVGDTSDEPDETFAVGLSSPSNATIGDGSGTGTITDDDQPVVQPPQAAVDVPEELDASRDICAGLTKKGQFKGGLSVDVTLPAGGPLVIVADYEVKVTTKSKGKKKRTTKSFRLAKLVTTGKPGEQTYRMKLSKGRCKQFVKRVKASGGGTLVVKATWTPAGGTPVKLKDEAELVP